MFGRHKSSVVVTGDFDERVDFNDICSCLSKESGMKVWWEEDNGKVNIMTDGNPNIVRQSLVEAASDIIMGLIVTSIIEEARQEAIIRMN